MTEHRTGNWRVPSEGEWKLLDRFVAGDIAADERSAIAALLSRDQALLDLLWLMRRGEVSKETEKAEQDNARRGWREFNIRMAANQSSTDLRLMSPDVPSLPSIPSRSRGSSSYAIRSQRFGRFFGRSSVWFGAVVGVIAMVAVGVTGIALWDSRTSAPEAMHEMATQAGQQARIRLADGTIVTIGPQSRLRISSDFGTDNRTVMLEGMALFDVSYDATLPLIVKTRGATTRVLGTKFNVHAFQDTTTVAVAEGKVALESDDQGKPGVTITPGYVGQLTPDGNVHLLRDDINAHVSWADRRFVFRDAPMNKVLTDLSRWYAVQFTVSDSSFLQRRLTAEWENRSLDSIVKALEIAFDIRVKRDGEVVRLFTRESDRHSGRSQE